MSSAGRFESKLNSAFQKLLNTQQSFAVWAQKVWLEELYAVAQLKRWQTKNASEGSSWAPLNPRYVKWKQRHYEGSPGGGRKMMIASGRLLAGVLPPQRRLFSDPDGREHFRKILKTKSITIATSVPYAKGANEERPFATFSRKTRAEWSKSFATFHVKQLKGSM